MCIRKENIGKILLAAIIIMVLSQVIHTIGASLTMDYYTDEAYAQLWSKIMMPEMGPPPMSFYVYSLLSAFIFGLIFASVYDVFVSAVPGETWKKKGLYYGLIIFILSIYSFLALYLLINLPAVLIGDWALEDLIIDLLSGLIVARLIPA